MSKAQLNYFHPIIIFGLGWLFFCIMPIVFSEKLPLIILLLSMVLLLSFFMGYFISYNTRIHVLYVEHNYNMRNFEKILPLIFIAYSMVKIYIIKTTEISSGVYADKYIVDSQLILYLMIFDKIFNVILLFALSIFSTYGKIRYYTVFLLSLVSSFFEPTRLIIIFTAVYWVLLGVALDYIKIRIVPFVLVLIISPFLFSFLLIKRVYKFEGNSYEFLFHLFDLINYDLLISGMINGLETFESYNALVNVIKDDFIHPLSGFIRIIFMPIPRTIWPDKPESVARLIAENYYPHAYQQGGGQLAGPVGDAYINLGVIGIFIIWFFLGFISSSFYKYFKRGVLTGGKYEKVYYCVYYYVFLVYFVNCLRGFASDLFWTFLVNLLMLAIIKKFFFRKTHPMMAN
ncbi:O-antigen polymerase [Pectobacterium polonicum]|uniref:O-antigen polymerase n=1 Tax=Pectobacterium polonicum TaxID=2485124 RepID=A0ABV1P8T8_9GAMM|nr:O-antigen polymerase [Pectobacterium polonicum]MDC9819008.1 O-antigen ligase [Pectobacterium polonicum]